MDGVTLCHDRKSPYSQIMEEFRTKEVDQAIATGMYFSPSFSCGAVRAAIQTFKHYYRV